LQRMPRREGLLASGNQLFLRHFYVSDTDCQTKKARGNILRKEDLHPGNCPEKSFPCRVFPCRKLSLRKDVPGEKSSLQWKMHALELEIKDIFLCVATCNSLSLGKSPDASFPCKEFMGRNSPHGNPRQEYCLFAMENAYPGGRN
jgi:hypothetical protein